MSVLTWTGRRHDRWADREHIEGLRWSFRQAAIGAGVALAVDAPIAGTGWRTPEVTRVTLGPPLMLTVRMLEGQVPAQLARVGHLIAPHLGGRALRVVDRGFGWALVTVLTADPLTEPLPLVFRPEDDRITLGRDEGGELVTVAPTALPHVVVQGQTGSGKSTWLYGFLVQLARAGAVIGGVDPSAVTLRPFRGTGHARWQAHGLADLTAVESCLAGLVELMDDRVSRMPADVDVLPVTTDDPLMIVLLEEWPATLRALDAADTKLGKRVRALVARLLAESRKVGFRVVLVCQRAEANIIGAAERGQAAGRLSFRVDSADSIKLLHADVDDLAVGHTTAPPGIALLSWPGRSLSRIRGPFLGSYAAYRAAVAEGVSR